MGNCGNNITIKLPNDEPISKNVLRRAGLKRVVVVTTALHREIGLFSVHCFSYYIPPEMLCILHDVGFILRFQTLVVYNNMFYIFF